MNPERDELEWSLLDLARERRLPVWGICRGLQVLNVYLGGSLWQDLPTQAPSQVDHSRSETPDVLAHTVKVIAPDAPIGDRLTRDIPLVNSRHHQAVRRAADGFVPVALSPDGLVEAAVLDRDDWWVRAVQWHPENLVELAQQRALWIDFIQRRRLRGLVSDTVHLHLAPRIATLTIDRPPLNVLDIPTIDRLGELIAVLATDPECW